MATLTIRNIPDELHARLKERAKANRRSLNQEVIVELAREVDERRERVGQVLESVKKFRAGLKKTLSTEEIREAIEDGRD